MNEEYHIPFWKDGKFWIKVLDVLVFFGLTLTTLLIYRFDNQSNMTATNVLELVFGYSVVLGVKNIPWTNMIGAIVGKAAETKAKENKK